MRRSRAALIVVALLAGIVLGASADALPGPLGAPFDESGVVASAIDDIESNYIDGVDRQRLENAAITGAVRELDDEFSSYLSPREYERFENATHGRFQGVGITVRGTDAGLRVIDVIEDSPAARAGIRRGDVVVAVDGRSLTGRPADVAIALIKGPSGTDVRLRLRRDDATLTKVLERQQIEVPAVESELRRAGGERVAHITLAAFSSGAREQLEEAIRTARDRGARAVVLDLRGNGGGLVKEAQLVASEFLDEGEIVTTRGRSVPTRTLAAVGTPAAGALPVVVLVDEATASAAEIVAGALQDHERAVIVGTTTFGKGVFQQVLRLPNGGALNLTAGRYFTPDGRNLAGAGITPDVRVRDRRATERDEPLRRALELLAEELDAG